MPTNKTLDVLTTITEIFVQGNIAVPIIFGTVNAIAMIIRGVTGSGPKLSEIADMLEDKVAKNDANIKAEIARMQALLGQ